MRFELIRLNKALAKALYLNARYSGSSAPEAEDIRESAREALHKLLPAGQFPNGRIPCTEEEYAALRRIVDMIEFVKTHKTLHPNIPRFSSNDSIAKYMRACMRNPALAPGKAFLKKVFGDEDLIYPTWLDLQGGLPDFEVEVQIDDNDPDAHVYDRVVFDESQIYSNKGLYQNGEALEASEEDEAHDYDDPDRLIHF